MIGNEAELIVVDEANEMNEQEAHEVAVRAEADKRVKQILKKHRREITRLKALAEKAIIEDNKDSYIYAIGKLRDIYKQPHTPELLETMWVTTRQTVLSML